MEQAVILHFDGGCKKKIGSGGYIAYWQDKCIGGEAKYYGPEEPTNNVAKARAMVESLKWLENQHYEKLQKAGQVVLRVDSQLIISFL